MKKLLSILLTLCMLLALLPALPASMAAETAPAAQAAAFEEPTEPAEPAAIDPPAALQTTELGVEQVPLVDWIKVWDIDEPVAGQKPDYICQVETNIPDAVAEVEVVWHEVWTFFSPYQDVVMNPEETFKGDDDHCYYYEVLVTLRDGYHFHMAEYAAPGEYRYYFKGDVEMDSLWEMDGIPVSVDASGRHTLHLKAGYFYPDRDYGYGTMVNHVTVSGLTRGNPGDLPDTSISVTTNPSGAVASSKVNWYNAYGSSLTSGDHLQNGYYTVYIQINFKQNYALHTPSNGGAELISLPAGWKLAGAFVSKENDGTVSLLAALEPILVGSYRITFDTKTTMPDLVLTEDGPVYAPEHTGNPDGWAFVRWAIRYPGQSDWIDYGIYPGDEIPMYRLEGSELELVAIYNPGYLVTELTVSGLDEPEIGSLPDYNVTVRDSTGAGVKNVDVQWFSPMSPSTAISPPVPATSAS